MLSDGLFTAARRRLDNVWYFWQMLKLFQLAAARRRLADKPATSCIAFSFQLTAARRRLAPPLKPLPNKACIALFR